MRRDKQQPKQKNVKKPAKKQLSKPPATEEAQKPKPRTVYYGKQFVKDYKREKKGIYKSHLDKLLEAMVNLLVLDEPLPAQAVDHPLTGSWKSFRDCHLKPDLVLIYKKPDAK